MAKTIFIYFQMKLQIFGGQTNGHYKKSLSTEGSKILSGDVIDLLLLLFIINYLNMTTQSEHMHRLYCSTM